MPLSTLNPQHEMSNMLSKGFEMCRFNSFVWSLSFLWVTDFFVLPKNHLEHSVLLMHSMKLKLHIFKSISYINDVYTTPICLRKPSFRRLHMYVYFYHLTSVIFLNAILQIFCGKLLLEKHCITINIKRPYYPESFARHNVLRREHPSGI